MGRMLRFVLTAFLLLLPLLVIDIVLTSIFAYFELDPNDAVQRLKRAKELAEAVDQALVSQCTRFFTFMGIAEATSHLLASLTVTLFFLLCYLPVVWLIVNFWRVEMRTYKKLVQFWKDRKAVPD